jgi:hypothetical protein
MNLPQSFLLWFKHGFFLIGCCKCACCAPLKEQFFSGEIKGKRIFLKYDKLKHDEENVLLCYLYLENKAFFNAHLIQMRAGWD